MEWVVGGIGRKASVLNVSDESDVEESGGMRSLWSRVIAERKSAAFNSRGAVGRLFRAAIREG